MAVTEIIKQARRSGTSGFIDEQTFSERFWIKTNDYNDNMLTIRSDPLFLAAIPGIGEPHSDDQFFTRRNIRWDSSSPLIWFATVEYSTKPLSNEDKEKEEFPDPVDRRVRMGGSSQEFQVYRDRDAEGNPYVNSAGDPLEAEPFEDSRIVIPLRKNVRDWTNEWFLYNNKTNSSSISVTDGKSTIIVDEGFGLFKGFGMSDLKEENGFEYYEASGVLHIATDSDHKWNRPRLDQGFFYIDGSDRTRFTVKDNSGNDQDSPTEQLLDGSGGALATNGTPVFLEDFVDFTSADFTNLPFFKAA